MFRLAKKPTSGLALLLLVPAFLIPFYFSTAHTSDAPILTTTHTPKRSEHEPNFDPDHDGLPDSVELRTLNDRGNFLNQPVTPEG